MYWLLYQNTPTCHLDQEHSLTTREFRARAFCIVSLNFLWRLFFCRCFLLSHHISRFAWTEGSPGTGFPFKNMSAAFLNIFHHIVCWDQSGSGKWFQWLMAHPAKMLASKQSSHYVCTMWCSEFGLSSWETNVSLSWMRSNCYLGTLFHGSHGLRPVFPVAHPGKRKAKQTLPFLWCWPCK